MKKLLSVFLMIVLCIGCLTSCMDSITGMFPLPGQEAEKPADSEIQAAADVLEALVSQDKAEPERNASFDVPTTVVGNISGTSYTVEWSVDDSRIAITDGRKEGYKTIVIPEINETEFTFVLTALLKGDGEEYKLEMRVKCPVKKDIGAASNIETGKAYLLAMEQSQITGKPTYYATGAMLKYWFAVTENSANGINFYFEETTGGYHMYAKYGETKSYVNVISVEKNNVVNINCVYEATPSSVWVWDDTLKTVVTDLGDVTYFLGAKYSNKNLTPLATSETEKISVGKIVASSNADKNSFYVPTVDGAVKPVVDTKYNLAINMDFGSVYYTTGAEGSKPYYLLFNEDQAKAANFYLEATEGGYHIYGMINGAKKYLNIRANGDYVNSLYETAPNGVWVWNDDLGIFTVTVNNTLYTLGSEGYDNLNALTLTEASYRVCFVPSTNEDQGSVSVSTSTIAQALEAADDDIVKIEGVIVGINGTEGYVVKDSTGAIYIYQSAGELVVGDKVTVQGTKDTYYGFEQIKSATVTKTGTETVEHGTATFYTGADLATYKAGSSIAADYISFKGTLVKSNSYYNVEFADTTAIQGSLKVSSDLASAVDALAGKLIVVKGYFAGTSGTGGKYVNIIVTEIEAEACEHTYNTLSNKCDICGQITNHDCADADSNNTCDKCGEPYNISVSTIAQAITATDDDIVKIEGVIVAIEGTKGYVVKDATGAIYVFTNAGELVVGDKVTVQGTKDTYYGFHQIANPTATKTGTETVEHGTATFYTGTDLATFKAGSSILADYISFQGTLKQSSTYYNVEFADTTAIQGSLKVSADLTAAVDALADKMIVVKGYFAGTSGTGGKYVNLIVTEIELYVCEHVYTTLDSKCDKCGEIIEHTCVDADSNNSCDKCGASLAPVNYTLEEANGLDDGVLVILKGVVISNSGKNMTIKDATGTFALYNISNREDIEVGDTIQLEGPMSSHNGNKQLKDIAAEIIDNHSDTGCTYGDDDKCTVCGAAKPIEGTTTATYKIADAATANGWTVGGNSPSKITTHTIDSVISMDLTGGSNTGKIYSDGVRIYQTESPSITISAATGYTIVSVKVTYTISNSGVLKQDTTNIASGTVVDVNADSIVFGVGNTGDKTNGQVRISQIEVVYKAV